MRTISAVIFDLDGTLIDSEPLHQEVDAALLLEHGVSVPDSEWDSFIGVAGDEFIQQVRERFGATGLTAEVLATSDDRYLELARGRIRVFRFMRDILVALLLRGVKLGVATSSSRAVLDAMLEETGLDQVFAATVAREDAEKLKPAPDAFLRVARSLNVPPEQCCVIEDSQYGVQAARAAGMEVIAVPATGHETLEAFREADVVVTGGADNLSCERALSHLGLPSEPVVSVSAFRETVYAHYRRNRRPMPWRETTDAYHILVSEIMLQQTQSDRVEPRYDSFLRRFPTVEALAEASLQAVLSEWQGLGYNRRAKYLKDAAARLVADFSGSVPRGLRELRSLPGIGPYTAGAVRTFAFNRPSVFVETNIRRVVLQVFYPDRLTVHDRDVLPLVGATLDHTNPREWYYALMDYGAYLARAFDNANRRSSHYVRQAPLAGSVREVRGRIIRALATEGSMDLDELERRVAPRDSRFDAAISGLRKDGLLRISGNVVELP